MQEKIALLSDEMINQIAAGEVVESPVSVIKELVENALDAGAEKIVVEIIGGGMKSVRVQDDGKGMDPEDAQMSIVRHATSKICKPSDLFCISTKGFRGEALASIASISKMTLTTAMQSQMGTRLVVEKGKVVKMSKAPPRVGTTVEVESLFYNVPARRKFQKSGAVLAAKAYRMVTLLALSHPKVQITLISNGKTTIETKALDTIEKRAYHLLGSDFTQGAFPLFFKEGPLCFEGLIGNPTNHRPSKIGQYLFIEGRGVECGALSDAVKRGYDTRLPDKRYPIFYLHLHIPLDLVDVNVHPQKLHVRLRREQILCNALSRAVEQALSLKSQDLVEMIPVKQAENVPSFTPVLGPSPSFALRFSEEAEEAQGEFFFAEEELDVWGPFGAYLFVREASGNITLVDLEAAASRVLYEELLKEDEGSVPKQGLIFPFSVTLTTVESAMLLTHQEAIEALGFSLRHAGRDAFMVEAIPSFMEEKEVKSFLIDVAEKLQNYIGKSDYEGERRKVLARLASRFAKKGYDRSEGGGKELFKKLQGCKSPLQSPKGEKTMVDLSDEKIQSLFRAH